MNKAQLVEAVAEQLGGRRAAAEAVDAVLDAIVRATVAGDRVSVTGFGTFERVDRSARYARNPQTGERVRVKKTSVPRFRPGQGFKDLVSGAKKLPKTGPSVKKAPKGSLTPGKSGATTAAAKRAAAKKSAAASGTTAKKTAAKRTPAAKKATGGTSTGTTARKTSAKKTAPAAKSTATKVTARTAAKKTAPAKKTATTARKTAAKKTAKKTATKRAATS